MSFPLNPIHNQAFTTALGTMYLYDSVRDAWIINGGGASGFSGISGFSGASGYSGVSGFSGKSGYSGYSGISGFSGKSGYSGDSGKSGYSGSGISGFSGKSGYSGGPNFLVNGFPAQPLTPTLLYNIADSNLYYGGITGMNYWVQIY